MKTLFLLLMIPILWLSGCSNYQYFAIQSSRASFNKYRTFAWLPVPDTSNHISDIVDEKIKDEVTADLEKRGFMLQTGRPDLLVRYAIQVRDRFRIYDKPIYVYGPDVVYRGVPRNRYGRYFYYRYNNTYPVYVGSDIEKIPYKEGTLIIDLIERRNHQVIWRGYGTGEVDNPQRAISDIPEVVEGILSKLPIAALVPLRQ